MPQGFSDFDLRFLNNSPKLRSDSESWSMSMIGCISAMEMVTLSSFRDTFSSSATIWLIYVIFIARGVGRFETNPQNVISLGPALLEVWIILEAGKKTSQQRQKENSVPKGPAQGMTSPNTRSVQLRLVKNKGEYEI